MINRKRKNTFIQFIFILMAISLLISQPSTAYAQTEQKSSLLNYNVDVVISGGGSLYWDYGSNMSFFLSDDAKIYNHNCKIPSNSTYKFSKIFSRGLIPQPQDGFYFAGFYGKDGKKISLTKTTMDVLRVSVDGIYHYDYYESYGNTKFKNYTKTTYKNKVKAYLKTLYGTSRYTVMDTITLYKMPKKDAYYEARFEQKKSPVLNMKSSMTKTHGDEKFYILPNKPSKYTYSFKSSNRKILTIDKLSGYVTINGPGTVTITCKVAETETTSASTYATAVTIKPERVASFSAKQNKKTLTVNWKKQSGNSGYEIQVSNNKTFATILASKAIRSSQANSAKLQLKNELFHNYARIRAYKTSKGKKIYSDYIVAKIAR